MVKSTRYRDGNCCERGHNSAKYVSTGICVQCQELENRQFWQLLPSRARTKYRLEALNLGDRFYRGDPCKRHHSGARYASTGACVQCYALPVNFQPAGDPGKIAQLEAVWSAISGKALSPSAIARGPGRTVARFRGPPELIEVIRSLWKTIK